MKLRKMMLTLSCVGFLPSVLHGASIAVNFSENGSNQTFIGGQIIGPTGIDSSNWNNTASLGDPPVGSFTAGSVIDDSGANVPLAVVSWSAPNMYYTGGAPTGNDAGKLVAGYLDEGSGNPNGFSIVNHEFVQYDLYIIVAGDGGNANGGTGTFLHDGFTINGQDYGSFTALGQNQGAMVEATGPTAGNYVKYSGLTGDLTVAGNSGDGRTPINGFVIVAVPEPSSSALIGLGGLALILRRRK
ncbi:PEP-CTERM sorting domain-containing protein [Oceaniferula marina]|uniref:PEP-CTERM sorting domain-containing protein n=1 Tax=Oceaniferula marina TaxID=2748318 RepID=UPI001D056C6F|nr:PEP-CTERM sorting domain-containing protein [Oceaniferula marina]